MMPPAGKYRDEITIQTPSSSQNTGTGEVTRAWQTYAIARAQVLSMGGGEGFEADAAVARATYQVSIRYLANITTTMRILWNGQTLYILSAVPDGRRTEIVLQCTENLTRNV